MDTSQSTRRFVRGMSCLAVLLTLVSVGGEGSRPALAETIGPGLTVGREPSVGAEQAETEYVPPPAKAYALSPSDLGPDFSETIPEPSPGGRMFSNRILAPDAKLGPPRVLSETDVTMAESSVEILPAGSDEVDARYKELLDNLRAEASVQQAGGWASEQVYSYARSVDGVAMRGFALQHRNAIAMVAIHGWDRFTTPEYATRLMHLVEDRIHAALQKTAASGS